MSKQRFVTISSSEAGPVNYKNIPGNNESGSEIEVNGLTETLSAEERHTLKHTQRQDPQGEEQIIPHSSNITSSNPSLISRRSPGSASVVSLNSQYNDSNLSMGSSSNTLIIHHSIPDEPWSNRWLSNYMMPNSRKSSQERSIQNMENLGSESSDQFSSKLPDLTVPSNQSSGTPIYMPSHTPISALLDNSQNTNALLSKSSYLTDKKLSSNISRNIGNRYTTSTVLNDIPSSYLDQSEVLKHLLTKDVKETSNKVNVGGYSVSTSGAYSDQSTSSSNSGINILVNESGAGNTQHTTLERDGSEISALLSGLNSHPPPPSYHRWQMENNEIDLKTTPGELKLKSIEKNSLSRSQPDLSHIEAANEVTPARDNLSTRLSTVQFDEDDISLKEIIDLLTRENATMKLDVELCHRKVAKLQRFELEMTKMEEQRESLSKHCERREQLERLARHKLQMEVRRLTDLNKDLKEQMEIMSSQLMIRSSSVTEDSSDASALKKELSKRDTFIAQLISQNKELGAAKERQEIELTAQRQTLNELRTHIDILDSALTNAQTNVVKLEEEVRKRQAFVEQAGQFKRLLLNMQLSSERREQSEKSIRQRLENELFQLRTNARMDPTNSDVTELRKDLREKDERIINLETDLLKWEQRFHTASVPIDVKMAAVERNNLTKRITDVESRNRLLEARMAEREALIRALQKKVEERDVYQSSFHKAAPAIRSDMEGINIASNLSQAPLFSPTTTSISLPNSNQSVAATPRRDEELDFRNNSLQYPPPNCLKLLQNHPRTDSFYQVYKTPELDNRRVTPDDLFLSTNAVVEASSPKGAPPFDSRDDFDPEKKRLLYLKEVYSNRMKNYKLCTPIPTSPHPEKLHATVIMDDQLTHLNTEEIKENYATSPDFPSQGMLNPNFCQNSPLPSSKTETMNAADILPLKEELASPVGDYKNRGDPPPYHSHHQVLKTASVAPSNNKENEKEDSGTCPPPPPPPQSPPLLRPVGVCQKPHPPSAFCRTCQNVRRSHRQNAAALVRRANSSGCQYHRRSAPSPSSSGDSLDDAPSILERLKKEWEMGMLGGGPHSGKGEGAMKTDGSKTLPHSLGTVLSCALHETESFAKEELSELKPLDGKEPSKKDAAHLDRALNRLSIKRASSQAPMKREPSTCTADVAVSKDNGKNNDLTDSINDVKRSNDVSDDHKNKFLDSFEAVELIIREENDKNLKNANEG